MSINEYQLTSWYWLNDYQLTSWYWAHRPPVLTRGVLRHNITRDNDTASHANAGFVTKYSQSLPPNSALAGVRDEASSSLAVSSESENTFENRAVNIDGGTPPTKVPGS